MYQPLDDHDAGDDSGFRCGLREPEVFGKRSMRITAFAGDSLHQYSELLLKSSCCTVATMRRWFTGGRVALVKKPGGASERSGNKNVFIYCRKNRDRLLGAFFSFLGVVSALITIKTCFFPGRQIQDEREAFARYNLSDARQYHPDRPPDPSPSAERFAQRLLKTGRDKSSPAIRAIATKDFKSLQKFLVDDSGDELSEVERRLFEGRVLVYRGEYIKGIDSFEQATRLAGSAPAVKLELAHALMFSGDLQQAARITSEHLLEEGVVGNTRALALDLMGHIRFKQGEFGEAEEYFRNAVKTLEKLPGRDGLELATAANDLGQTLSEQGEYEEAGHFLNYALGLRLKAPDVNALELSETYNDIGLLNSWQSKYIEAERFYWKAIRILRAEFGDRHPELAMEWNNLGSVYFNQQRYTEALPLYGKALDIWIEYLGPEHFEVARAYINIGTSLQRQKNFSGARSYYEKGLNILSQEKYRQHPYYGALLVNMATLAFDEGRFEEAESTYLEALKFLSGKVPKSSRLYLAAVKKLADFYSQTGREKEAARLQKAVSAPSTQ